jgi:hypothetical protein
MLQADDSLGVEAVPVVFITNEVFQRDSPGLVADIVGLLERTFPYSYQEIQIDCDWTAGTRDAYFDFLTTLAEQSEKRISCTVRLHQYRDREQQGIPPVDRIVLMAYNTGDLGSWETRNSIVDSTVIAAYLNDQPPYPLALDLAVAVYDWAAVYRYGELAYLINEPDLVQLGDSSRFERLSTGRYRVTQSTYLNGLYLYRRDLIRLEIADRAGAMRLADRLWKQVANGGSERIVFYRAGSRQWRR